MTKGEKGALCKPPFDVRPPKSAGFTFLELLVALTLLVFAFAIIWETFSGTVQAWQRGSQLLDELRHGDFVMEQLVSALRSAAFFKTNPGRYGFRLETGNAGSYPGDKLSWVTVSSAFIPPDSVLSKGTHRLIFSIEDNDDGEAAVCIRAYDPLLENEDTVQIDRWFVSTEVQGIQCRVYNPEEEIWENSWEGEQTNSLPSLMEITLYMDPIEKSGEPVTLKRVVEIPIAPAATNAVKVFETKPQQTESVVMSACSKALENIQGRLVDRRSSNAWKGSPGNSSESGSALIVALWTLLILALLIGAFAFDMHVEAGVTSYYRKRLKAQYLAYAGVELAKVILSKNSVKDETLTEDEAEVNNYQENSGGRGRGGREPRAGRRFDADSHETGDVEVGRQ